MDGGAGRGGSFRQDHLAGDTVGARSIFWSKSKSLHDEMRETMGGSLRDR